MSNNGRVASPLSDHQRRQMRRGLAMTPRERMRWLEQTRAALLPWLGLARTTESNR